MPHVDLWPTCRARMAWPRYRSFLQSSVLPRDAPTEIETKCVQRLLGWRWCVHPAHAFRWWLQRMRHAWGPLRSVRPRSRRASSSQWHGTAVFAAWGARLRLPTSAGRAHLFSVLPAGTTGATLAMRAGTSDCDFGRVSSPPTPVSALPPAGVAGAGLGMFCERLPEVSVRAPG
ncbi:hypothetical protein C8J57DRAFT_1718511 [Mycena rebaudengoi]|nr:hypothetical protein C8J57DRAFT_1718511 [Mycena rebaudengoi]